MITKMQMRTFPGTKSRNCSLLYIEADSSHYVVFFGYDTPECAIQLFDDTHGMMIAKNTSWQANTPTVQRYFEKLNDMYNLTEADDMLMYNISYYKQDDH